MIYRIPIALIIKKLFLALCVTIAQQLSASWAHDTLCRMSLDEKIGQLFIVAATNCEDSAYFESIKNSDTQADRIIQNWSGAVSYEEMAFLIERYAIGGIHYLGYGTVRATVKGNNYFQHLSKYPLLMSQDFEWGPHMRLKDAHPFPKAAFLGVYSDDIVYKTGYIIGKQCRALGVHINYAPVVDVNSNPENPVIKDRSFGSDPEFVALKALAFMNGLRDARVISCAKHFPGHGDTNIDSHIGLPVIMHEKKRLHAIELYPFKKLIDAQVPLVMTAHISVPAFETEAFLPATLSYDLITNLLKKELGFNGLVITDALNMKGITQTALSGDLEVKALQAGVDILLMSQDVPFAHASIKKALHEGIITLNDIDRRVLKILLLKEWAGIHQDRFVDETEAIESLYGNDVQELLSIFT